MIIMSIDGYMNFRNLQEKFLNSKHKKLILEGHSNKIIIVLENSIKKYFEDKNYQLHRIFCEELI